MRRTHAIARLLATATTLSFALLAPNAVADETLGGGALDMPTPTAGASPKTTVAAATAGGSSGPAAPSFRKLKRGVVRPVVDRMRVPSSVVSGVPPKISVRFRERGTRHVTARIVVLRALGGDPVARISLGSVRVGAIARVRWPKSLVLAPGSYIVRVHAKDHRNHVLQRKAQAAGRTVMAVTPAPAAPSLAGGSGTPGANVGAIPITSIGVFPVQGAHTYGDGIGAARDGHTHQGQDIRGAAGTPIVAPLPGTILKTDYQADGAGYYVVQQTSDGRSLFFAHCQKDSFGVQAGQAVLAGASICRLGSTGASTGPHLHFEIWEGGWRTSAASHFINPTPQLLAWDHV